MLKKEEKGIITLEACVSVLSFLVLMLMMSGLFIMFMAQNQTAHSILQTSESLSIDSYAGKKIGVDTVGSVSDSILKGTEYLSKLFNKESDNNFSTNEKWYEDKKKNELAQTIKNRFVVYISGEDYEKADKYLKNLSIVDGLDGMDFSESYIANDTLYIVLKYNLEYEFNIWGLGVVPVYQTTCSKLW